MILDAPETVLGTFGFDRTIYGDSKKRKGRWWHELIQERRKDIVNLVQIMNFLSTEEVYQSAIDILLHYCHPEVSDC